MKHRPVVQCRTAGWRSLCSRVCRCKGARGADTERLAFGVPRSVGRSRWTPTVHSQTRKPAGPTSTTQSHRSHRQLTSSRCLSRCVRLSCSNATAAFEPPAPKAAQTKATRTAGDCAQSIISMFFGSQRCDWSVARGADVSTLPIGPVVATLVCLLLMFVLPLLVRASV
jgi:hypothetical protein